VQSVNVIPIFAEPATAEEIADLAFEFWISRCFREHGSPEEALLHAILEITYREVIVRRTPSSALVARQRTLCPVVSIDRKKMDYPAIISELRLELEQIDRAIMSLERLVALQSSQRSRSPGRIAEAQTGEDVGPKTMA
jgi:hypothetical protein